MLLFLDFNSFWTDGIPYVDKKIKINEVEEKNEIINNLKTSVHLSK